MLQCALLNQVQTQQRSSNINTKENLHKLNHPKTETQKYNHKEMLYARFMTASGDGKVATLTCTSDAPVPVERAGWDSRVGGFAVLHWSLQTL